MPVIVTGGLISMWVALPFESNCGNVLASLAATPSAVHKVLCGHSFFEIIFSPSTEPIWVSSAANLSENNSAVISTGTFWWRTEPKLATAATPWLLLWARVTWAFLMLLIILLLAKKVSSLASLTANYMGRNKNQGRILKAICCRTHKRLRKTSFETCTKMGKTRGRKQKNPW